MLVRNRGRLLTHRALLQEVWGQAYAEDVPTPAHPRSPACVASSNAGDLGPSYIRTDPGVGYRFDA